MSRSSFDVIVVGGGPGGASTAIACSARGLRTLLLEANTRTGLIPGETLHPGMESLFRGLGVDAQINEADFVRHPGHVVRSRGQVVFEPYGSDSRGRWLGYQADRSKLHEILLDRALACGTQISRGEKAIIPVVRDNRVEGVVTTTGTHSSQFVVDASGHGQWLCRKIGIPSVRVSPPLVAHYGWVELGESTKSSQDMPEFQMDGSIWNWISPISADRCAWVSLDLMDQRLNRKPGPPSALAGCCAVGRERACDVTWKIARPSSGPGYFIVGDASWVLDPASSHGVLKAITSARIVGEAIEKSVNNSRDAMQMQISYNAWMEGWFCSDARALISLYSEIEAAASWLSAASATVRYISMSPSTQAFSINRRIE
jgi:flavin-dependent dehydrogenase